MIDRIFTITLTLAVLIGSTLAIGSDFVASRSEPVQVSAVTVLPRVVVTGHVERVTTVAQSAAQSGRFVQ